MRKKNAVLTAFNLLLMAVCGILNSFRFGGAQLNFWLRVLLFILVATMVAQTVLYTRLTAKSRRYWNEHEDLYPELNGLFKARFGCNIAAAVLVLAAGFVYSCYGIQVLLILALGLYTVPNVRSMLLALGTRNLKARIPETFLVFSLLEIYMTIIFLIYTVGWNS